MNEALGSDDFESPSAYPASIQAGIPKLGETPTGWRRYPLDDLLRRVERPAILLDRDTYQLVTAKRNRGGIVAREVLRGDQIRTKTQFYVETGDFLISNRQISHGACGIVPASLHRSIVSNEYTTFHTSDPLDPRFLHALCGADERIIGAFISLELYLVRPDTQKIHPSYLKAVLRLPSSQAALAAHKQGTGLTRIPKEALAQLEIPLPALETQRKIADLADLVEHEGHLLERLVDRKAVYHREVLTRAVLSAISHQP